MRYGQESDIWFMKKMWSDKAKKRGGSRGFSVSTPFLLYRKVLRNSYNINIFDRKIAKQFFTREQGRGIKSILKCLEIFCFLCEIKRSEKNF